MERIILQKHTSKQRSTSSVVTKLLIIVVLWLGAVCLLTVLFGAWDKPMVKSAPQPTVVVESDAPYRPDPSTEAYLVMINNLRESRGIPPLAPLESLEQSAQAKAIHMAAGQYWGHYDSVGVSYKDFIWRTTPKANFIGENLARCFGDRTAAFNALVASPSHLEIMLDPFTHFGSSELYDATLGCTLTVFHFASF
jgi:uncharacterized protein YkwD